MGKLYGKELYDRIEALGKGKGYKNMTELCRAADVPRTTMSELKSGRSRELSKTNAEKFGIALGMTYFEVYGDEENTPTGTSRRELTDEDIYGAFFKGSYSEKKLNKLKKMAELIDDEDDEG